MVNDLVFGGVHDVVLEIPAISVQAPSAIVYDDNNQPISAVQTPVVVNTGGESVSIF